MFAIMGIRFQVGSGSNRVIIENVRRFTIL